MIQFEDRIGELVTALDPITINPTTTRSAKFYWGTAPDLPAFLKVYKENHYPLIWLNSSPDTYTMKNYVRRDCQFILATRETDKSLLNTQRTEKSYKLVLNPLLEAFLDKLRKSNISHLPDDTYRTLKLPNYSTSQLKDANATMEIWDAIQLNCTVEVNRNTYKNCA